MPTAHVLKGPGEGQARPQSHGTSTTKSSARSEVGMSLPALSLPLWSPDLMFPPPSWFLSFQPLR